MDFRGPAVAISTAGVSQAAASTLRDMGPAKMVGKSPLQVDDQFRRGVSGIELAERLVYPVRSGRVIGPRVMTASPPCAGHRRRNFPPWSVGNRHTADGPRPSRPGASTWTIIGRPGNISNSGLGAAGAMRPCGLEISTKIRGFGHQSEVWNPVENKPEK